MGQAGRADTDREARWTGGDLQGLKKLHTTITSIEEGFRHSLSGEHQAQQAEAEEQAGLHGGLLGVVGRM